MVVEIALFGHGFSPKKSVVGSGVRIALHHPLQAGDPASFRHLAAVALGEPGLDFCHVFLGDGLGLG